MPESRGKLEQRRFIDQTIIVTGAGSGIGRACSLRFGKEGASVVVADINESAGRSTAEEVLSRGGKAFFVLCDVSRPEDLKNLVAQALEKFKRLDVIVNNAALMEFSPLVDLEIDQWDRVIATNLRSVFVLCKYGLPHIRGGAIVNVSSVHAHETTPSNSAYASSKGAVEALTRALSTEVSPAICRVNAIAPGAVNTPMLRKNPNVKNGQERIFGRIGEPEEIASAICFLASHEASFIHGTTLIVDGGQLDIL
jgi:glucose 1-dehydrogenase